MQHMAPFGISTIGFCMVFRHATLVFSTPGTIFGPPDLDLGPGWPGPPFLGKKGGPENMTLWKKWSLVRFEGDLCEGIGLYGIQEAFGQAHFPPNPTRKSFYKDFPISRKSPWAPLALHGDP